LLGDAAEVHVSSQRAKIIAALKEAGLAMTISALIETTGMKRNALDVLLGRMAKEGEIQRIRKGLYAHLDYISPSDDPPPANPPNKTKNGKSKRGTPRQTVASVRSSKVLTVLETEAPSAQTQGTTGKTLASVHLSNLSAKMQIRTALMHLCLRRQIGQTDRLRRKRLKK
jgi:hypothetical protein